MTVGPRLEEPYQPTTAPPIPWETARDRLAAADGYVLATVRPDGRPHLVPVLGVWVAEALHVAAGPGTRKVANLARDGRCAVSARTGELDLVVEGRAHRVTDAPTLTAVADAYAAKYGWAPTARDGALRDVPGAPTAGPPPYLVHRVAPTAVLGFPLADGHVATRWRF